MDRKFLINLLIRDNLLKKSRNITGFVLELSQFIINQRWKTDLKITDLTALEPSLLTIGLVRFILIIGAILLLRAELYAAAILSIILFLISCLSTLWSKKGLKKLNISYQFEPQRLFAGDNTNLKVVIENKKILPTIIKWQLSLPAHIILINPSSTNSSAKVSFPRFLKWHESYEMLFPINANRRGYFTLKNPHLISSDAIGLSQIRAVIDDETNLIVYPRILPLENLDIKASDLMGDKIEQGYILPDPIMAMGLREYRADMPAYLINWKASAKQDTIMAKLIEPSADYKLCLIVDVDNIKEFANGEEIFEKCLSIAASIAVWADELKIPTGLIINVTQTNLDSPILVPVNSSPSHILLVLEKLARANYESLGSWQDLLKNSNHKLPWGTSIIVIRAEYSYMPNIVVIPALEMTGEKSDG